MKRLIVWPYGGVVTKMQMDNTEIVAVITVGGVIVNAIMSALISLSSSRKSIYIASVTNERMKWIADIRDTVAEFQAIHVNMLLSNIRDPAYGVSDRFQDAIEQALKAEGKLEMHLIGRGNIEDNIVLLTTSVSRACMALRADPDSQEKLRKSHTYIDLLSAHCNFLFKQEWERVKIEASGTLYSILLRLKYREFKKNYVNYCREDGYFVAERSDAKYEFSRRASKLFFRAPRDEVTHPSSTPQ